MRVFITGIRGQLGRTLQATLGEHKTTGIDLPECDISDRPSIEAAIADAAPDVVVHCAAMTDVDGCARDPQAAYRVNGLGTQNVALACQAVGAAMLCVSTNEVFDGTADRPYLEFDAPHPINSYGRSKLAGEWYTRHLLNRFYIVRTSWLYAPDGRNFSTPRRIVQLADERGRLKVVTDEVGSPTYVVDLARAIAQLIASEQYGVYHFVNEGSCSRFDYVREVLRIAGRSAVTVEPTTLTAFQRDSTPPAYAPLANVAGTAIGIRLRPWQEAVAKVLNL
ncbi:MAG: dTDP-4-dehydrorhamnose reductase [Anaerolineae bacterium]|jgi:dTDP-4-dehydrorhamnose reductase